MKFSEILPKININDRQNIIVKSRYRFGHMAKFSTTAFNYNDIIEFDRRSDETFFFFLCILKYEKNMIMKKKTYLCIYI